MKNRLVAHRGLASVCPENTRAALQAAFRLGLRWVEIDVQLTRDGVPVLYHDSSLRRVSGRSGDIRNLDWNRVRRLPACEPGRWGRRFARERVASLAQAARLLRRHPRARMFVELKEESLRRFGRTRVLEAVLRALGPAARQCVLISFDEEVLRLARQRCRLALGPVLRRWRRVHSAFFRKLRPEFVFCDARRLPRRGRLRAGRARLCVYEVPDPLQGRAWIRRGAALLETFAPQNYL